RLAVAGLGLGVGGAGLVVRHGGAEAGQDVVRLFLEQPLDQREVVGGGGAVGGAGTVANPLGELGDRHAAGGEIFHQGGMDAGLAGQAVDALGAAAVEPALDVLHHHARVAPGPFERDRSGGDLDADGIVVG